MGPAGTTLVPVHILGLPIDVYGRASEHNDELLREFALIREDRTDHVPSRLLTLIDQLQARFGAFTQGPTSVIHDALARGEATIDLRYDVPAEAGQAALHLAGLLDEADDFCRAGDLLTLAANAEAVAFRRWFLEEFVRQIDGRPPRPWSAVMEGRAEG